ncbi:MAG: putative toxin-antitoxin system toxin component, PIN family [Burkholderiales bacterium]
MRVFLDTNVLVSAFAARGLCAELVDTVLLSHELVTGRGVLRELERALREKVKATPERCDEAIASILSGAAQVVEAADPADCEASPEDALVLGEAVAGEAELFVTGDTDLLRLESHGSMRIISPRKLWDFLRSEKEA